MHLWFLVHGLYGDVGNLQTMQEVLVSKITDTDHVHIAKSNQRFYTFDGIEVGALRLYDELMHVIAQAPAKVTQISIVGYSLGGLYTRYLIGLLHENRFFDSVQPVVYATFASPHLGSTQWNPKYGSWLLNSIGTVMLGVSGAELLCRWRWGLLQKMSEPGSKYYEGLALFDRRFLFANAVNDRSVHFWTAFITNKIPFAKEHGHKTELAFYSYNGDPQGHFIVDLERSRHTDSLPPGNHKNSSGKLIAINLVIPFLLFILFFVSMRSFVCYPFLICKWRLKHRRLTRRTPITKLVEKFEPPSKSPEPNYHENMDSQAQRALDTLPPKDVESNGKDPSVSEGPTTTYPKPVLNNDAPFVDSASEELPFNETMTRRLQNLNSLGWEKYVVYLEGNWSHAHIINRRHQKESQGTELIKFFVDEATKAKY